MKLGVGVLFVAIGLVILWASVTGRLSRLPDAWATLKGDAPGGTVKPASNPATAAADAVGRMSAILNVPANFPIVPTFSLN